MNGKDTFIDYDISCSKEFYMRETTSILQANSLKRIINRAVKLYKQMVRERTVPEKVRKNRGRVRIGKATGRCRVGEKLPADQICVRLPGNQTLHLKDITNNAMIGDVKVKAAHALAVQEVRMKATHAQAVQGRKKRIQDIYERNWGIYLPFDDRLKIVEDTKQINQVDRNNLRFYPKAVIR